MKKFSCLLLILIFFSFLLASCSHQPDLMLSEVVIEIATGKDFGGIQLEENGPIYSPTVVAYTFVLSEELSPKVMLDDISIEFQDEWLESQLIREDGAVQQRRRRSWELFHPSTPNSIGLYYVLGYTEKIEGLVQLPDAETVGKIYENAYRATLVIKEEGGEILRADLQDYKD